MEEKNVHPGLFFPSTRSPKDSTDEFNLSKTDLNVFLLPSTVCGRQHRLQEPEERRPWLLKVLQATPGAPSLAWPPAVTSAMWNIYLSISSVSPHALRRQLWNYAVNLWTKIIKDHMTQKAGSLFTMWYLFICYLFRCCIFIIKYFTSGGHDENYSWIFQAAVIIMLIFSVSSLSHTNPSFRVW